jgi:AhpD family alkylhydroperoxidase
VLQPGGASVSWRTPYYHPGWIVAPEECAVPFLKSLPADAGVRHVVGLNPEAGRALIQLHIAALRNESALAGRDKELIAAFVSALNARQYCYGVHAETARAFGFDDGLVQAPGTGSKDPPRCSLRAGAPCSKTVMRRCSKCSMESA